MMRPLTVCLLLALPAPLTAQHALGNVGSYDPAVPPPSTVLGYELGETFTPHHLILRYAEAVARSSPRVTLDTVARSFEGREVLLLIVTSEANHRRLDEIRGLSRRIADPRGVSAAELARAVARTPVIVWLGYTVHGNEASGVEAALATLYDLAAGLDPETRMILDSTVVLIDPVQNPDGHERHVQDMMRDRGVFGPDPHPLAMDHSAPWHGARTSHYLFDLNRDWIVHSHPETRGRMAVFRDWHPHVGVDLHEMGSNSTYFFAPPMAPVNQNVAPSIRRGWDLFARGNAAAFADRGAGFFTREGYDEFFPGYGPSWPLMTGAVGMTYEQGSSRGGAIRRDDGSVLTLRDAATNHYIASRATLRTAATHRAGRVRDYAEFRRTAADASGRGELRTIVFERDRQGRADSLVSILERHGIEVGQLRQAVDARAATVYGSTGPARTRFPAGSYVVDLAQPQGVLAKALLEPEAGLDSAFIREELERRRTGQGNRFYDLTGWSLPYLFRLRAWHTAGPVGPVTEPARPVGAALPEQARYAYAFEPGSDASLRMLAGLLADSIRVRHAPRWFRVGGDAFPYGAFIVLVERNDDAVHDRVRARAAESGARVVAVHNALVDEGTDLGSTSVRAIPLPSIALVGSGGVSATSFGAAWFTFDQILRFPVTRIRIEDLVRGLDGFNVVVIPSAFRIGNSLGDGGVEALQRWVRSGGTLVTLDAATAWLASPDAGLARLRLQRDTAGADDQATGAPLPLHVPGAILRAAADTLSTLLAGVSETEIPVVLFSDRFYRAPHDVRPGEVVIRYADAPRLRLAGYLWPEVPDRVAASPYLWTERVGQGRVIGFTGDPNFRLMVRGLLPLFANAVFLGPAM